MSSHWLALFEREGYALFPDVVPLPALTPITRAVEQLGERLDLGVRGGVRNLFQELPEMRALAQHSALYALVSAVLGPDCFVARAILFDKTPVANWKVVWHQDLSIAVRERREVLGFGPWSQKEGVLHVQPPAAVLERMVTLRLHLDDCGPANGPVRVLPGSHCGGRLAAEDVRRWRAEQAEVPCVVGAGGVLLMRPLLLHASSPATAPAHRRVIHLEYAAGELPGGLAWAER